MKLAELLDALTKYYAVIVIDNRGGRYYEDQTVVPAGMRCRDVNTCDFYEDSGDGESLHIHLYDEG